MLGIAEQACGRCVLDDPSGIHHRDVVGDLGDDT
jgi:hypothetical protein